MIRAWGKKEQSIESTEAKPVQIVQKHPLAIRWFHWINFPVLTLMIWSGILIYWAVSGDGTDPANHGKYTITLFGHTLIRFFPDWFYAPGANEKTHNPGLYSLGARLAEGMSWHFLFMWIFAINGLLYVLFVALSGEWRYILPNRNTLKDAIHVVLHDLHLSKKPLPERKFNGAQQIAYTGVIIMGLGSLITGIAIYKPVQASWFTQLLGGYERCRFFHFWLMMFFIMFFMVHFVQVVRAGWNNFRAMITGAELVAEEAR
jgi:thiosulfate reductase cytochrome b subunit